MEWISSLSRITILLTVLYIATVIELSFPAGEFVPSTIALAATLMVCLSRSSTGVFWAALGGFLLDATSRGHLGPLLMAYGVIAVVFTTSLPTDRRTWWFAPALSGALAAAQPLVAIIIARLEIVPAAHSEVLLMAAITRGGVTACAAAVALITVTITRRVWSPSLSEGPMTLSNRWRMITE